MNVPDALERRHALYGSPKKTPNFQALGDAYFAAGRSSDALESYERIPDAATSEQSIAKVRKAALKAGDHFLLWRIHQRYPLAAGEWREAAEAAKAGGRLAYALKSARQSGDEGLIGRLEEQMGIAKPAESEASAEGEPEETPEGDS